MRGKASPVHPAYKAPVASSCTARWSRRFVCAAHQGLSTLKFGRSTDTARKNKRRLVCARVCEWSCARAHARESRCVRSPLGRERSSLRGPAELGGSAAFSASAAALSGSGRSAAARRGRVGGRERARQKKRRAHGRAFGNVWSWSRRASFHRQRAASPHLPPLCLSRFAVALPCAWAICGSRNEWWTSAYSSSIISQRSNAFCAAHWWQTHEVFD